MLNTGGISKSGRDELALLVGRGRRLVSVADVARALELDRVTAAKRLARWSNQGWLRRVRRGLYIPVPVDAEDPRSWSEDPLVLADAVWNPCFFTGWTAANHWTLTEQVFRTTVVKTAARVRQTRERLLDDDFYVVHVAPGLLDWGTRGVWRGDRRVRLADPARTVIDVFDNPKLGGGIRLCAEFLTAYLGEHDWRVLVEHGDRLGNKSVFKRVGYVLEAADLPNDGLLDACRKRLSAGITLLDPSAPPSGVRSSVWGLRVNVAVRREAPS